MSGRKVFTGSSHRRGTPQMKLVYCNYCKTRTLQEGLPKILAKNNSNVAKSKEDATKATSSASQFDSDNELT